MFDVLIPGLLIMNRHPMLYSYNVVIMKVLFKSDDNENANHISDNSQAIAYRMIYNSDTMDLIILCNTVEFVQKLQALLSRF